MTGLSHVDEGKKHLPPRHTRSQVRARPSCVTRTLLEWAIALHVLLLCTWAKKCAKFPSLSSMGFVESAQERRF